MRAAALLVLLLISIAVADDRSPAKAPDPAPPAQAAPAVIQYADLHEQLDELRAADITTLARVEAYRALLEGRVVRATGKVLDVRPRVDGQLDYVICELAAARVVMTITRPTTAERWERWDRISWFVVGEVRVDATIAWTRSTGPADQEYEREPNPGLEQPPTDRQIRPRAEFAAFLKRYARAILDRKWRTAWRLYRSAAEVAYDVEGIVTANERGTLVVEPQGNLSVRDPATDRAWGVLQPSFRYEARDPQLIAATPECTPVRMRLIVSGFDSSADLKRTGGKFAVWFTALVPAR